MLKQKETDVEKCRVKRNNLPVQPYMIKTDHFLWSFNTSNRLKLDLEKAHDYMVWDFLDFVMARKGFGSKPITNYTISPYPSIDKKHVIIRPSTSNCDHK